MQQNTIHSKVEAASVKLQNLTVENHGHGIGMLLYHLKLMKTLFPEVDLAMGSSS